MDFPLRLRNRQLLESKPTFTKLQVKLDSPIEWKDASKGQRSTGSWQYSLKVWVEYSRKESGGARCVYAPCKPFTISDQNMLFPIPFPIEPDQPFLFCNTYNVRISDSQLILVRRRFRLTQLPDFYLLWKPERALKACQAILNSTRPQF